MRKAMIPLILIVLVMSFPIHTFVNMDSGMNSDTLESTPSGSYVTSAAVGSGNPLLSTQFMSRVITGEQILFSIHMQIQILILEPSIYQDICIQDGMRMKLP